MAATRPAVSSERPHTVNRDSEDTSLCWSHSSTIWSVMTLVSVAVGSEASIFWEIWKKRLWYFYSILASSLISSLLSIMEGGREGERERRERKRQKKTYCVPLVQIVPFDSWSSSYHLTPLSETLPGLFGSSPHQWTHWGCCSRQPGWLWPLSGRGGGYNIVVMVWGVGTT